MKKKIEKMFCFQPSGDNLALTLVHLWKLKFKIFSTVTKFKRNLVETNGTKDSIQAKTRYKGEGESIVLCSLIFNSILSIFRELPTQPKLTSLELVIVENRFIPIGRQ